jgi:CBS domain containing-hemolysin-like protein
VPFRERTAESVLRLIGKRNRAEAGGDGIEQESQGESFAVEERNMVSGVLTLADRSIRSVMTPRSEMSWVDLEDDAPPSCASCTTRRTACCRSAAANSTTSSASAAPRT